MMLHQQMQARINTEHYLSIVGPEDYAGVQHRARGRVVRKNYRTKFFKAVCENNLRRVRSMASEKNVNKHYCYELKRPSGDYKKFSRTPLMVACKDGNIWPKLNHLHITACIYASKNPCTLFFHRLYLIWQNHSIRKIALTLTSNPPLLQGNGDMVKVLLEAKADVHAESTEAEKCDQVYLQLLSVLSFQWFELWTRCMSTYSYILGLIWRWIYARVSLPLNLASSLYPPLRFLSCAYSHTTSTQSDFRFCHPCWFPFTCPRPKIKQNQTKHLHSPAWYGGRNDYRAVSRHQRTKWRHGYAAAGCQGWSRTNMLLVCFKWFKRWCEECLGNVFPVPKPTAQGDRITCSISFLCWKGGCIMYLFLLIPIMCWRRGKLTIV